jgi:hypothetical protein
MSTTPAPAFQHAVNDIPPVTRSVERRLQPRLRIRRMAFIQAADDPDAGYQAATLSNISAEGMGLLLAYSVEVGTRYRVQFRHLLVGDRLVEVVHASPAEDGWLVGCKVYMPFSGPELRALLL